jgi:5S rRNA maturation endonuclease (ribonuclease M5)
VLYRLPELEKIPRAWERSCGITIIGPRPNPKQEAEEKRAIAQRILKLPYVLVVEGEKDVAAAESLGFTATCNPMGAKKWHDDYSHFLEGAGVVVIADADRPGREHAQQVAASLQGWAASVKVCEIPQCKDLAEAVSKGWRKGLFENLFHDAKEWKPRSGAEILNDIYRFIRTYMVMTEAEARVIALWIGHSHIFMTWGYTPYLYVHAPTTECGKSTLLKLLKMFVKDPDDSAGGSPASLKYIIADTRPTLLLDEMDTELGRNADPARREEYRRLLDAGFEIDKPLRCSEKQGSRWVSKTYDVYCPKVFAGIKNFLPHTVVARCYEIALEEGRPERQFLWPVVASPEGEMLAAELKEWCAKIRDSVWDTNPEVFQYPIWKGRDMMKAAPLLAVAEQAGGDWPAAGREGILTLTQQAKEDDLQGIDRTLARQTKYVFDGRDVLQDEQPTPVDEITSKNLAAKVGEIEGSPFADWHGKPLTPTGLARLLRHHKTPEGHPIRPVDNQRFEGDGIEKGTKVRFYRRSQFLTFWETYASDDQTTKVAVAPIYATGTNPQPEQQPEQGIPYKTQDVTPNVPVVPIGGAGYEGKPQIGPKPAHDPRLVRLKDYRCADWKLAAAILKLASKLAKQAQRGSSAQPSITLPNSDPGTSTAGAGLPTLIVGGHETAMLDIGNAEGQGGRGGSQHEKRTGTAPTEPRGAHVRRTGHGIHDPRDWTSAWSDK